MTIRICGAVLVILGCGGVGFAMSTNLRREERALRELVQGLEWMICQMQYQSPPLATMFMGAADVSSGEVSRIFEQIGRKLEHHDASSVADCIDDALKTAPSMPMKAAEQLRQLGTSLGQFDMDGQIMQFRSTVALCQQEVQRMSNEKDSRMRLYRTLCICIGVAVVIFLI